MIIQITRKKAIAFILLLFIILAIPITVYLSNRQQNTQSNASLETPDSTIVATVAGENITKADVRVVAEENIDPSGIDKAALQGALP